MAGSAADVSVAAVAVVDVAVVDVAVVDVAVVDVVAAAVEIFAAFVVEVVDAGLGEGYFLDPVSSA